MKVNIVKPQQPKQPLPNPPFRVTLASREDWHSFLDTYPELKDSHGWAGGSETLYYNPCGLHRYFHEDGRIQHSIEVDNNYRHYAEVRWPS